jgi:hypothetical protein
MWMQIILHMGQSHNGMVEACPSHSIIQLDDKKHIKIHLKKTLCKW